MNPRTSKVAVAGAVGVIALLSAFFWFTKETPTILPGDTTPAPSTAPTTILTLYTQDKVAAQTSDCGVTKKVTYEVPQTTAVADASLRILFDSELSRYGTYASVRIVDGVAHVAIDAERQALIALSSCEKVHIMSTLTDTLTQYDSISSVELYTKDGKVEF